MTKWDALPKMQNDAADCFCVFLTFSGVDNLDVNAGNFAAREMLCRGGGNPLKHGGEVVLDSPLDIIGLIHETVNVNLVCIVASRRCLREGTRHHGFLRRVVENELNRAHALEELDNIRLNDGSKAAHDVKCRRRRMEGVHHLDGGKLPVDASRGPHFGSGIGLLAVVEM